MKTRHGRMLATLAIIVTTSINGGSALAAPGDLDPSFGADGIVSVRLAPTLNVRLAPILNALAQGDTILAIALEPDGQIVALGTDSREGIILTRYSATGALDFGFGEDGVVRTQLTEDRQAARIRPLALALQPDGKLLVSGIASVGELSFNIGLSRVNADGSPDSGFGTDGHVVTRFGDAVGQALALQPDGKILAAGGTMTRGEEDFAIVRYLPDGSLDGTFGNGGKLQTDFGGSDAVTNLVLESDGKITAVGFSAHYEPDVPATTVIARYNQDGSLDPTYGNGGKLKNLESVASGTGHPSG
jgi:uncharacterized delta-60 repeat protein